MKSSKPVVGIIANPVSARDIRRIVAYAGNMQITDRANIVLRLLAGLGAVGIERVLIMPENSGIRAHVMRGLQRADNLAKHVFLRLIIWTCQSVRLRRTVSRPRAGCTRPE